MLTQLGRLFFRIRSYTPIPLILLMLVFARPTLISCAIGGLILMAGELGRLWAVGYAGSSTRTRSLGAARQLVTTGPYARVRNPLYVSNGLISMGVCALAGTYWLLLIVAAGFALQYIPIVRSEEDYLARTCGPAYRQYCDQVPRWFPSWRRFQEASDHDFSWSRAVKSERRTLLAIVIVCGLVGLIDVWKNA